MSSCEKEQDSSISRNNMRQELIKLSPSKQRVKFSNLTVEQQADIWRSKLEQVLKQEWLSHEQKDHLNQGYLLLNANLFLDNTREDRLFKSEFEASWRNEGIRLFSLPVFRQIVTSIEDFDYELFTAKAVVPIGEDVDDFECECSEVSDWCFRSDCTGRCNLSSPRGCGTFWRFSCNGVCI